MRALWRNRAEVQAISIEIANAIDDIVSAINVPPFQTSSILFPTTQVASKNANTLDDYEEGTWKPIDLSGAGLTFAVATATYIKIGQLVHLTADFVYPVTASGTSAVIGGLPFTSYLTRSGLAVGYSSQPGAVPPTLFVPASVTTILPFIGTGQATNAQLSNATLIFGGTYRAAT